MQSKAVFTRKVLDVDSAGLIGYNSMLNIWNTVKDWEPGRLTSYDNDFACLILHSQGFYFL